MSDGTTVLFVDTNGFIQVRDFKDIPWRELFPEAKQIDIMVVQAVISELDEHKVSTNSRRRNRARAALQLIDQASEASDFALMLRERPIKVRLIVTPGIRIDWATMPSHLDPANPDDQLVAQALMVGGGAAVFSHDTGPRIRARLAGLKSFTPDDSWLLPLETTDDQRKIASIERELTLARTTKPSIKVEFDSAQNEGQSINLTVPQVPPLDAAIVAELTNRYVALYPSFFDGGLTTVSFGFGYTPNALSDYRERYSKFMDSVHVYFETLHETVNRAAQVTSIDYTMVNTSGVTAQGLRVEVNLRGDGSIISSRDNTPFSSRRFEPPAPPKKPESVYDILKTPFDRHLSFPARIPESQDPLKFYWVDKPRLGSSTSSMQCAEFRPTRCTQDEILILPNDLPFAGSLKLHVSAFNLTEPVNIERPLSIEYRSANWKDVDVLALLQSEIAELVGKSDVNPIPTL